jgi:deazaflavin-dependent oxidoreductase (nitroreductase family)
MWLADDADRCGGGSRLALACTVVVVLMPSLRDRKPRSGVAAVSEPRRRRLKRSLARAGERLLINRLVRSLMRRGRGPSAYALLETTGRRSGIPRVTPVANGTVGDTFWLISAHGSHAHYVHNIRADPRVRIGVQTDRTLHWRTGTAHVMTQDDARARQRELSRGRLAYRLDALIVRSLATELTTVRIEMDTE